MRTPVTTRRRPGSAGPRARRTAAAAVAVAVLSGCGGAGSGDGVTADAMSPAAAMQRVAAEVKTTDSSSYTFEMAAGRGMSMKGHGSYRTRPELAMQMVFDSMSMGGMSLGAGGMEQRVIADTLYLRGGPLGMGPSGGKWIKLPFGELGGTGGVDLKSMLAQAVQADPRAQLQALLAAGNVREVGTENVGGVPTTHYAGDVSLAELGASEQLDAAVRDELKKSYEAAGMGATRLDVWVDSDYQPRKFVSEAATAVGDVRMTMTFADFGKAVEIAAPPADEVMDMSSLAKLGRRFAPPEAS